MSKKDNETKNVNIFASGNLDEYKIEELSKKNALIDAFGVGTAMGVSKDAPYCDIVYKLVELSNHGKLLPTMKLSKGKITYPGKKQVYRSFDKNGDYLKDILALRNEKINGQELLVKVMEKGKIVYKMPSLEYIRKITKENLSKLPNHYKKLRNALKYKVEISN